MFSKYLIILGVVELLSLIPLSTIAVSSKERNFWRNIFISLIISGIFFITYGIIK